jgi:hypothetical protein
LVVLCGRRVISPVRLSDPVCLWRILDDNRVYFGFADSSCAEEVVVRRQKVAAGRRDSPSGPIAVRTIRTLVGFDARGRLSAERVFTRRRIHHNQSR